MSKIRSKKNLFFKRGFFLLNISKKFRLFLSYKIKKVINLKIQLKEIEFKKNLFKKNNLKILFKKINNKEYSNISCKEFYTSYLQTASYIESYSKKYLFYKLLFKNNIIGKFAISIKKYLGINFYIINRISLEEYHISNKEISYEYIYYKLIIFLKNNLHSGLLIILPLNNVNSFSPIFDKFIKILKIRPYVTGLIKLNQSIEDIKINMKSRWRRQIKNGEKLNYEIVISDKKKDINSVINIYKNEKNYDGLNTKVLEKWYLKSKNKEIKFISITAYKNVRGENKAVGFLLFCIQESTSTYLLGVFKNKSENKYVSNILLWNSIIYSKKYGCNYFDLGGIDTLKTPGIAHFKLGLNPIIHKDSELKFIFIR